ncbi:MAG: hypothetical protein AB8B83_08010 [Bdellovibrionales bacterium]
MSNETPLKRITNDLSAMTFAPSVHAFRIPKKEEIMHLLKKEPYNQETAILALILASQLAAMKLDTTSYLAPEDIRKALALKSVDTLSTAFGLADHFGLEKQIRHHRKMALTIMDVCQIDLPIEHPLASDLPGMQII